MQIHTEDCFYIFHEICCLLCLLLFLTCTTKSLENTREWVHSENKFSLQLYWQLKHFTGVWQGFANIFDKAIIYYPFVIEQFARAIMHCMETKRCWHCQETRLVIYWWIIRRREYCKTRSDWIFFKVFWPVDA